MKCCTKCKRTKPPSEFGPNKRYKGGRLTWCRDCTRDYKRARTGAIPRVPAPPGAKRCLRCKAYRPGAEFHKNKARTDGLSQRCRPCQALHSAIAQKKYRTQPAVKARYVERGLRRFGLTVAKYEEMLAAQGGVCAICKQPETYTRQGTVGRLCVDHDHKTGQIRGLLCHWCNLGVSAFKDEPTAARAAALYLERKPCQLHLPALTTKTSPTRPSKKDVYRISAATGPALK